MSREEWMRELTKEKYAKPVPEYIPSVLEQARAQDRLLLIQSIEWDLPRNGCKSLWDGAA